MTTDQIDQAILAAVGNRWRKVAMVIGIAADAQGVPMQEGEAGLKMIAERIETLVGDGRLLAQGDLKKWRFSEVRQP